MGSSPPRLRLGVGGGPLKLPQRPAVVLSASPCALIRAGGEHSGPVPVLGGISDQALSRPQTRISEAGPPLGDGEARRREISGLG